MLVRCRVRISQWLLLSGVCHLLVLVVLPVLLSGVLSVVIATGRPTVAVPLLTPVRRS